MSQDEQRGNAQYATVLALQAAQGAGDMSEVNNTRPAALALASIALSLAVLAEPATDSPIPGIRVFDQAS